jgi:hypothetical protein
MNAERQGLGPHLSFNLDGPRKAGKAALDVVIDEKYNQETTITAKVLHCNHRFGKHNFPRYD